MTIGDFHNIIQNKSDEAKRLTTSRTTEEYFKKSKAVKEATSALERGQQVPAEFASLVNVQALKNDLESAKKGEQGANVQGSNAGGGKGEQALSTTSVATSATSTSASKAYLSTLAQTAIAQSLTIEKGTDTHLFNPLANLQATDKSISFIDDKSAQTVSITLNDENITRLANKFGSLDKAADFVKGWYNEAAYGVGYLQADNNADGTISQEEAKSLKSLSIINKDGSLTTSSLGEIVNTQTADAILNESGWIDSLNDFVNQSIKEDSNLNGSITLAEMLGGEQNIALLTAQNTSSTETINSDETALFRNVSTKEGTPFSELHILQIKNLIQNLQREKSVAVYRENALLSS